ncbi:MAG: DUF624 domain-containing protein [Ruminococcus sp.]|nr:DUF624 domain-containing protein [Ruminococcus sp.]
MAANDYHPRGLARPPREKKGIFKFFEVYGRRFWKLLGLNAMYFMFFVPVLIAWWLVGKLGSYVPLVLCVFTVISFGPATTAMTKICRNYSQERNAFFFADFKETFVKCFGQSCIMGIIDIIFIVGFSVAIPAYMNWAQQNTVMYIPLVISLSFLIVFFMMHFYIYLMICSTNLSLRQILKNSFILVPAGAKASFCTLLVWIAVIFLVLLTNAYAVMLIPIWPLSFLCFVTAFNCYPLIRKYVIQPYYDARGEKNPEFDYLDKREDEKVFEDKPELDKPVEKKRNKQNKKSRTIS